MLINSKGKIMSVQGKLNQKLPLFLDILEEAQKSDNPVAVLKKAIAADVRVTAILGYSVNPRFKLPLPEGIPPYRPSDVPTGLAEVELLHQHKLIMMMFDANVRAVKKEELFVKWLEAMCELEAKILVAIKDQDLVSMYPKLTHHVIVEALGWDKAVFDKMKQDSKQ